MEQQRCRNCGSPVEVQDTFCPRCGRSLGKDGEESCGSCGSALRAGGVYCPSCGAAQGGGATPEQTAKQLDKESDKPKQPSFRKRYSRELEIDSNLVLIYGLGGGVHSSGRIPISMIEKVRHGHVGPMRAARIILRRPIRRPPDAPSDAGPWHEEYHAVATKDNVNEFIHDIRAIQQGHVPTVPMRGELTGDPEQAFSRRLQMLQAGMKLCPACGKNRIQRKMGGFDSAMTGIAIVFLFTAIGTIPALLYLLFVKKSYKYVCRDCRYKWEPLEPQT